MPKTPEQIRAKQREANVSRLLAMLQHYIKRIEDDEGEISKNISLGNKRGKQIQIFLAGQTSTVDAIGTIFRRHILLSKAS